MLSSLCPYCETPKVLICSGDRAGQSYWPIGAGILGKEAAREGSGTWGRKGEKVLRHQIDVLTLHAISKRQRQWRRLSLQPLYFPGPDCTSLPEIVSSFISGTPNDSASATGLAAKADKARTRPGIPTGCPEIPSEGVDAAPECGRRLRVFESRFKKRDSLPSRRRSLPDAGLFCGKIALMELWWVSHLLVNWYVYLVYVFFFFHGKRFFKTEKMNSIDLITFYRFA